MARAAAPSAYDAGKAHALPPDDVLARLASARRGLDKATAARRLAEVGPNRVETAPRRSWLATLAAQFTDVLIYVLLVAAAMTAWLGHYTDTGVILAVVIINGVIGFVQERRAEHSLSAINKLLAESAHVRRDGRVERVPVETIVPGDVVLIEAGDKVPADLRLLTTRTLQVQEAILTGESAPADKDVVAVAADAPLGDRASLSFAGTIVTRGRAEGVAIATGNATEIGRINAMLGAVRAPQTPLTRQLATFGRSISLFVLVFSVLAFAFGYFVRGMPAADLFFAVVGIAVAAVPEGLPAIVTIALAVGMERMARRKAIVRYLAAVETLGAVGVICSDKTGTFTLNEMTVETVVVGSGTYRVSGRGYEPSGSIAPTDGGTASGLPADVIHLGSAAAHCNDARLIQRGDQWLAEGDPMEAALLAFAAKADIAIDGDHRHRDAEIPFDPAHRFMATLSCAPQGPRIFVKGAPEQVLAMCNRALSAGGGDAALDPAPWRAAIDAMTARGLRVLALAEGNAATGAASLALADFDGSLRLIGLAGLMDPPRDEAVAAVADCRAAGIAVKMITGDHIGTAKAIAARLGLARPDAAMSGAALARMSDAELPALAMQVDVFARTSPEDKLRLVRALQKGGAVVAMTGDGVNDSPALKQADVGVAMGLRGSAAAREVARIVLADDNFATIAAAVEEGRRVYDNLRKAIIFILPTNGGEAFAIIAAIALGITAPISPLHILWINLVTEITLSLALAFEAAEPDVMRRPPRAPDAPILTGYIVWRIVLVTVLMLAGTFATFEWLLQTGASLDYARTAAVNAIVAMEASYLLSARRLRGPGWSGLFQRSAWATWSAIAAVTIAELAFTYLPPMNTLFASAPLRPSAWGLVLLAAAVLFAASEIEKRIVAGRRT